MNFCNFIQQRLRADVFQIPPHPQAFSVVHNIMMTPIRLSLLLFLLQTQNCYSQCNNPDSLLNKFRSDVQIEKREYSGVVAMDDETRIYYYSLISKSSIQNLIKYTNDSDAFIRSYVFVGLLRRNLARKVLAKILDLHKNDTAKFTSRGADVVVEWTVTEYMQAGMNLKSNNKLSNIDYKKEIKRLGNQSAYKLRIGGIHHGLIDKKELLKIDSLTLTDEALKVISFKLYSVGQELSSTSNILTEEMKILIEKAEIGDVLSFDNIRVTDKKNTMRRLASLSVRLK